MSCTWQVGSTGKTCQGRINRLFMQAQMADLTGLKAKGDLALKAKSPFIIIEK
jgi:hypothetical protein